MLRVALTGGIATGKSYVLERLGARGIPTIDADEIVHDALGPGTMASKAIANRFGAVMLREDGSVDRARLAERIFADPAARADLEAILHPHVYETIRAWFAASVAPVGVASIPLLYETRHESDFDFVVVTVCAPEQQLQRVMQRGLPKAAAVGRIAAQMPTADKARRADFVIDTGGTFKETNEGVEELLRRIAQVDGR